MSKPRKRRVPLRPAQQPATESPVQSPRERYGRLAGWVMAMAVALMIAVSLVPSDSFGQSGSGAIFAFLWFVVLAGWAAVGILRGAITIRYCHVDLAVTALIGWHVVSAMVVVFGETGNGRFAVNVMWQWLAMGCSYLIARQLFDSRERIRQIAIVFIGLSVVLSSVGLFQYGVVMPRTRTAYFDATEGEKQLLLVNNGVGDPGSGSRERELFENRLRSIEPTATLALANSLAVVLSTWLLVIIAMLIGTWRERESQKGALVTLLICAVLIGICLVLTKSRTAFLACAIGMGTIVLFWNKIIGPTHRLHGRRAAAATGFVLLAGGLGMVGYFMGGLDFQMLSEASKSLLYRLEYWEATLEIIWQKPWFGCGPGNFQSTYTRYMLPQSSETIADPHNAVLEIWSTVGTPGLLFLGAIFIGSIGYLASPFNWLRSGTRKPESTHLTSQEDPLGDTSDSLLRWIPIGGLVGILISFPVAVVSGIPHDPTTTLGAILFGGPCCIALYYTANRVGIVLATVGIALIVFALNLLATGGIGIIGVAQSGWLLLAVTLNLAPTACHTWEGGKRSAIGLAVAAILAALLCQQTAMNPIFRSSLMVAQSQEAMSSKRMVAAIELALEAGKADPLGDQPAQLLSSLMFDKWQTDRSDASFAQFEAASREWIRRHPNSRQVFRQIGIWYLMAFESTSQVEYGESAIHAFENAVTRNPNNGLLHAQLAWALYLVGDQPRAKLEAAEAMRLDKLNPHFDTQLNRRYIFAGSTVKQAETAEQLMNQIRITETVQ